MAKPRSLQHQSHLLLLRSRYCFQPDEAVPLIFPAARQGSSSPDSTPAKAFSFSQPALPSCSAIILALVVGLFSVASLAPAKALASENHSRDPSGIGSETSEASENASGNAVENSSGRSSGKSSAKSSENSSEPPAENFAAPTPEGVPEASSPGRSASYPLFRGFPCSKVEDLPGGITRRVLWTKIAEHKSTEGVLLLSPPDPEQMLLAKLAALPLSDEPNTLELSTPPELPVFINHELRSSAALEKGQWLRLSLEEHRGNLRLRWVEVLPQENSGESRDSAANGRSSDMESGS